MEYNLLQLLRPKTLLIFHSFIFMFNLFLKWEKRMGFYDLQNLMNTQACNIQPFLKVYHTIKNF